MTGDITKLPKWAQQEIKRLNQDLAYYRSKLQVGPDDSNTFADPYSDARRPLGHDTTIEFVLTNGHKIRARLDRNSVNGLYDRLYVSGDDGIAVFPNASNSVEIQSIRRMA